MKPFLLFFPPVLALTLFFSCTAAAPRITSIHPRIGKMGAVLAIRGAGFGGAREESWVTIAGNSPTAASYLAWTDELIMVRVPEIGEAGLVYVHRDGKKSNPTLFSNEEAIPVPFAGETYDPGPRISAVEPRAGAVGSLVTITGHNFGAAQEGGGVFFTWGAASPAPSEVAAPVWVGVREEDFGYESWSDREIRVRVPGGAVSGNIEVRTVRGAARPGYFEVTGRPGSQVWRDKRSYAIAWSVDIRVAEAVLPNTLYLWLPRPADSAVQRRGELISLSAAPFIENYRGVSLFKFDDITSGEAFTLAAAQLVEVYAVENSLRPQDIRGASPGQLESVYTKSDPLVPSDAAEIKALAASIIGREQNPYHRARLVYEWMLRELSFSAEAREGDAVESLSSKMADAWQAAFLFCALARSAGVPALPVSGVLVDRARETAPHFWAEFWVRGFGWIPVDAALGGGAAPADFTLPDNHAAFYFGNMDNQHIAFSHGIISLSRMDRRGRVAARERDYSLQTIREEAAGGLESYSSLWSGITVTGVYVQ